MLPGPSPGPQLIFKNRSLGSGLNFLTVAGGVSWAAAVADGGGATRARHRDQISSFSRSDTDICHARGHADMRNANSYIHIFSIEKIISIKAFGRYQYCNNHEICKKMKMSIPPRFVPSSDGRLSQARRLGGSPGAVTSVGVMWDPGSEVRVNMSQPHPLITQRPAHISVTTADMHSMARRRREVDMFHITHTV